jgi:alcohol dehydrogenase class IV
MGFEKATELFRQSPRNADAIIGFGGGKALDVARKKRGTDRRTDVDEWRKNLGAHTDFEY